MLLPVVESLEQYRTLYRNPEVWRPAVQTICQRHGLDASLLELAPPGSHVVFTAGPDTYLKLFCPLWAADVISERLVLDKLTGRPELPVPQLLAEGEIEEWPYLIMTAVPGVPLCQVWGELDPSNQQALMARCGQLMVDLHAIDTAGLETLAIDWPFFVESQLGSYLERLAGTGLDQGWQDQVSALLVELPPLFDLDFRPVLLSADITDEHLLVSQRHGRWELTGFIDFGDAMLGHPYYDLVAPACCLTRGRPDLLRVLLLAYGFGESQLNHQLAQQLMGYTLVHRFVNLPDLLAYSPVRPPADFAALMRELWSFQ